MADQIVVRDEGGTRALPPEGQFAAVCCDVIDLGMHENKTFGKMQHKCAVVFQIAERDPSGRRFEIAERFTVSMNEKSRLRAFLAQWRGKSYSEEEARQGVPLHKLEGQPAILQIEHKANAGKTYANIVSVMKVPPGYSAPKVENYTRGEGWKKAMAQQPAGVGGGDEFDGFPAGSDEVDDLPFN